jgi:hypothetical protein
MKSVAFLILIGLSLSLAVSMFLRSLPVISIVFIYLGLFALLLGWCRYAGISWGRAFLCCLIFSISNIGLVRAILPRQISRELFIEGSSLVNVDKALWRNTGGQYLLLASEPTFTPPAGQMTFIIDSEGKPMRTTAELEELFSRSFGRKSRVTLRNLYCDMAFRKTGVIISVD